MNFEIRSYSWSKDSDFELPAWSSSKKQWSNGFEKLWGSSDVPKLISDPDDLSKILSTKPNQSSSRQIVYIPYNLVHENKLLWRKVCEDFKLDYPMLEKGSKFAALNKENQFPVLALVLDTISTPNKISELTIMIPHWESIGFLRLCLWSIKKHYEKDMPKILVIDDLSAPETFSKIEELRKEYTFDLIQIRRPNKSKVADVGMLLDLGLNYIQTKYVCMLDADTVHTSNQTYSVALEALSNRSVVSCGLDTGLGRSYHDMGALKQFEGYYPYDISLPGVSTVTNNLFRVMRTMDAVAISRTIQFSRQVENRKVQDQFGRLLRRIAGQTKNQRLINITKQFIKSKFLNSQYPSMPPTGDNGVSANHWMEENKMGLKLNIPIVSYGVLSNHDGICFQNIGGKLVHIALSTRALSKERREIEDAGQDFYDAIRDIAENDFEENATYENVVKLSNRFQVQF
jgi:hypothetical protein